MVRKYFSLIGLVIFSTFGAGCGKPAGPDQTLNVPAGWTVDDHPHGDLYYSKWILQKEDSTKAEMTSFVAKGAPEETLKKMEVWKEYMGESMQYASFVSRGWMTGKYNAVRFFAYRHPNDTNHGTVSLWLIGKEREFAITISNPNMTREPLTALADKFADDLAKAN
jgi:hypothetical protein